jgi:hypothetical protein
MTTREALSALSQQGVSLTYWRLRGLIDRNEIPRPRLNSSLSWDWTRDDLAIVAKVVREKGCERGEPANA